MASTSNDLTVREFALGEEPDADEVVHPWQTHAWTVQEIKFVAAMLQHGSPARSYVEAVPEIVDHPRGRMEASSRANRLLKKEHIKGYIEAIRTQMMASMIMQPDEVLAKLSMIARANMADYVVIQEDGSYYVDFSHLTREQLAAVGEVTVEVYVEKSGPNEGRSVRATKFKLAPALPALELLGKKHKLWTDVIEDRSLGDVAETLRQRRAARIHDRKADGGDASEPIDDGSTSGGS